jgi:hypothetical protein
VVVLRIADLATRNPVQSHGILFYGTQRHLLLMNYRVAGHTFLSWGSRER